jgi:eukaryotic-like serine/threonine-protein kinase
VSLGIIHRDLKPRNLFLTLRRDGKHMVKVLDFGLAKPVTSYGSGALTATTAVLGSPQYMSPEQMRATRDVDHRTDVWSLGVCLYELLTRRMPFEADTVPVLCALVLKDQPKLVTEHRPEVPYELARIIARCLEKDPVARFADVQQLAAALEPFGSAESRGASARILSVLHAVAPASVPPGATTKSFAAGRERSQQGIVIAIVSSALVLGLTGAILIALAFTRANDAGSASSHERDPAVLTAAKKKSALVTESTPNKAASSSESSESRESGAPGAPAPLPSALPVQGKTAPPTQTKPENSATPSGHF